MGEATILTLLETGRPLTSKITPCLSLTVPLLPRAPIAKNLASLRFAVPLLSQRTKKVLHKCFIWLHVKIAGADSSLLRELWTGQTAMNSRHP